GHTPAHAESHGKTHKTTAGKDGEPPEGISPKAATWMEKNQITQEMLDHTFSVDGEVEVIASKMPGTSKRQQTVEAYIVTGLASYLATGSHEFTDDTARAVCKRVGCYDQPNHSNYLKAMGN